MKRIVLFAAPALAAVVLSACSTVPLVTKQRMTLAEANIAGLECRHDIPIGSNMPRTVCASAKSWAAYDANRRKESEALFAETRKLPNAGRYNRD